MTKNKFDDVPEPKHVAEVCDIDLSENEEGFLAFCRRAFGTSKTQPLVYGGEPLAGVTIGNMAEAFAICRGLGKQAMKPANAPGEAATRRAALLAGNEAPKTQ